MNNLSGRNLGRYHIVEPLGQGGMASVFKAYDTSLERYIAIKVIRTEVSGADDVGFLACFKREARALAQLDHPYILKVLVFWRLLHEILLDIVTKLAHLPRSKLKQSRWTWVLLSPISLSN